MLGIVKCVQMKYNSFHSTNINSNNLGNLRHLVDFVYDTSTLLVHETIQFDPFSPTHTNNAKMHTSMIN